MKKLIVMIGLSALISVTANHVFAQIPDTSKKVTPAITPPVQPTGDVINALSSNANYSTAAQLIKAANLEPVLKAGGPYTIFAPNNIAFSNLPVGRLDSLTKDTAKLTMLLKSHIVTGRYAKADIIKALTAGKGKATLTTLNGQTLTLAVSPKSTLQVTNAAGNTAEVILYDLVGTNGIINGINSILMTGK
ncbi:fasciclin domain-containing protein [Mucilaginibacter sp.]|uniref:fasciclin domain-containing protein n=1 Tax=Mucilaginibacter sp. TaxID=1882438 RepID=UPI00260DDDC6|nr:fasciclin domain-containing protein [Mucilaginibacter sp.]